MHGREDGNGVDEEQLQQAVLDKLTKVCICKGISRGSIKKAIAAGAKTLPEVQRATGAGSGSCGGKRCGPKIEALLAESSNP